MNLEVNSRGLTKEARVIKDQRWSVYYHGKSDAQHDFGASQAFNAMKDEISGFLTCLKIAKLEFKVTVHYKFYYHDYSLWTKFTQLCCDPLFHSFSSGHCSSVFTQTRIVKKNGTDLSWSLRLHHGPSKFRDKHVMFLIQKIVKRRLSIILSIVQKSWNEKHTLFCHTKCLTQCCEESRCWQNYFSRFR